jgi:transcriptional regulator with XRE-family HTH domain
MDFKDISARMKEKKGQEADTKGAAALNVSPEERYRLRGKMLGVLLLDARIAAGRSLEDCAGVARVEPEMIAAWEFGDAVPSLPQLEMLAYYLGVPVSHFWGQTTLESSKGTALSAHDEYMALRSRMIGALLRQAREELGMSQETLAQSAEISLESLSAYELGDLPLPMHELSVLSSLVKKNMSYFLESSSQIGELLAMKEEWKHFATLPEEMRRFAANPINIGFIRMAIMFAQLPTEQLREIGTSILDITM